MEDNANNEVVQPEVGEQQQPDPVIQSDEATTPMAFKDKIMLVLALGCAILIGIATVKSMDRSDVNATQILENDGSHNILDTGGWR